MKIGTYTIFEHSPTFIIAELSANHNGELSVAMETIRAAKRAGADAVKLQTYTADTITLDCNKEDFLIKGTISKRLGLSNFCSFLRLPRAITFSISG